jgi:hypothetical protein
MKNRRHSVGKRSAKSSTAKNKLLMLLLFAFVFITVSAIAVEAGPLDSLKTGWSQVRVYVLSIAFWINAVIIFGVAFVLYTLLMSKMMGSDTGSKTIIYIVLGIIALVIASKVVASNGTPQYIWHNEQFRSFSQFVIGPAAPLEGCAAPAHSFWRSLSGIEPNPPCCGTGAYFTRIHNRQVCKQAILRVNENGSGLPALVISFVLFWLLFAAYGSRLGFNNMGAGGGKWFPIALSLLLAALMTNERITKNNVIMIGGWIAVFLLGNQLSKSLSAENDQKGSKKGFGFGLAYAFIQLMANMLGTSLWGGEVTAAEIGFASILKNVVIGICIGWIYSMLVGGGNIWSKRKKMLEKEQEKDIEQLINEGNTGRSLLRGLPGFIGRWFRPKKKADDKKKAIENLNKMLEELQNMVNLEEMKDEPNRWRIRKINGKIDNIMDKLTEMELAKVLGEERTSESDED